LLNGENPGGDFGVFCLLRIGNFTISHKRDARASVEKIKPTIPITSDQWTWCGLKRIYVYEAIAFEKKIKGWSRRKKEALIAEDWKKLVLYSQSSTSSD
jgi:hypothetical protein